LLSFAFAGLMTAAEPLRVPVLIGGHAFETQFFKLFEDAGIKATAGDHADLAGQWFLKDADVLVLYDMKDDIPEAARAALKKWVEGGKGVVALHHSIVDFTAWPWWYEEVTGGKYFIAADPVHGASENSGVEEMGVKVVKPHPVTAGVKDFRIKDEPYRKMWRSPKVEVLAETDSAKNDRPVVYVGPWAKSRVVYIQLGHDRNAFEHPEYQRLVRNAVRWAAGR
jgi:hypothetical protein